MLDTLLFLYTAVAIIYAASIVADWISANQEERAMVLGPEDTLGFLIGCILLSGVFWPYFLYRRWKGN